MIHFALRCRDGHGFDGWFRSGEDFERQAARDLVACPSCGSTAVEKALMRPAVAGTGERGESASPVAAGLPPEKIAEFHMQMQAMARDMRKGSHDVGEKFAEEARRIHFGESEERRIHGRASGAEVRALAEDGVPFLPLPSLPEDRN